MLKNLLQKFTASAWLEKLEKIFFSLFLLSIPLQTRLTFPTTETYLFGFFNEYATFFLYLSDIFLIITFFLYFVNNLTKINKISLIKYRVSTFPQLIPILLFILWSLLTIAWSAYLNIVFYKSIKLIELVLLFLYINKRLFWFKIKSFFILLFTIGTLESVLGISQYLYQHSFGLKILGESLINPNIDNVAKIVVNGERIIRAYATFPHPNIFAAFLLLTIFTGIWLFLSTKNTETDQIVSRETILDKTTEDKTVLGDIKSSISIYPQLTRFLLKLFHTCPLKLTHFFKKLFNINEDSENVSRPPSIASLVQKMSYLKQNSDNVSRETILNTTTEGETFSNERSRVKQFEKKKYPCCLILLTIGLIIQATALILTFSRLAWFGAIVIILLFIYQTKFYKLFHVKQFIDNLTKLQKILALFIILTTLTTTGILWDQIFSRGLDINQKYQESINNRVLYNDIATNIIEKNPISGIGNGNFTLKMNKYTQKILEWWQYQPVHNIYLLITSEMGIIGIIIFISFILSIFYNPYSKQNSQIVSRETLLSKATEDETILGQATEREIILLKYFISSIFITFLVMGLFDHYFWTLQQGQLTFWLVLGVLSTLNNKKE